MGDACSCCGKADNDQCFLHPKGVCEGEAHWLCNCICCPFVCPIQSCCIYLVPCFGIWCDRTCRCCWSPCRNCCPTASCFAYQDEDFPPIAASIGAEGPKYEWRRASEFMDANDKPEEGTCHCLFGAEHRMRLFDTHKGDYEHTGANCLVDPGDVKQGELGDCWLLGAFAAFAEVPGGIQNLFVNKEYSSRGKYTVRLYDAIEKKWTKVTVDDMLPCHPPKKGYLLQPAFAQPNGNELWVLILEKAFAKFCESYGNLEGGQTVWGLQALTGSEIVFKFKPEGRNWVRHDIVAMESETRKRAIGSRRHGKLDPQTPRQLFKILMKYNQNSALIACSISSGAGEQKRADGLIAGHAYSVLRVVEVDTQGLLFQDDSKDGVNRFMMVQLRNPWGQSEWQGDWGDNSTKWAQFPKVAAQLKVKKKNCVDDGVFWMIWDDFLKCYDSVEVCDRKQTLQDLTLEVHEEAGPCGVCAGCIRGCCSYYCACRGCCLLYCTRKPEKETIDIRQSANPNAPC